MGSFNTTCAVSRTPILEGQKVRLFFLVWNSFDLHYSSRTKGLLSIPGMESFCYPYDLYKVIGYPLLATYKDYNNYEFEDKDIEKLTLDQIRSVYIPNTIQEGFKEKDYNRFHDFLNIEHLENMEKVQDIIHSGSLRCKTPHGVSFITNMAIHEEIYQELILKHNWKSHSGNKNYDFFYNEIKKRIDPSIPINERLSEFQRSQIEDLKEILMKNIGGKNSKGEILTEESIQNNLEKMAQKIFINDHAFENPQQDNWLFYPFKTKEDVLKNLDNKETIEKIISSWIGGRMTTIYFERFNMHFEPVLLGHQQFDFMADAQRLFDTANIVKKLVPEWTYEEYIEIETEIISKKYLSLEKMEIRIKDFFKDTDDEYINFNNIIRQIKEKNIKSYVVGDKSDFDIFTEDNDLLYQSKKGSLIYFKD